MPRPSNSSRFYHPSSTGWGVQILSSSLFSFLHSSVTSSLLGQNILLIALFSNTLSRLTSPNVSDQVSHPYKTTDKLIVVYTLIIKFLDSRLEDKIFRIEWQQAFPNFNLQLISSWIEFWFVKIVPKYVKSSTLSNELLSIFILWPAQQTSYWEADSFLIEKLPAFYRILIFITVYTRKYYSTRCPSSVFLSDRSALSFCLCLDFPNWLFPAGFSITCPFCHTCASQSAHLTFVVFYHHNIVTWGTCM